MLTDKHMNKFSWSYNCNLLPSRRSLVKAKPDHERQSDLPSDSAGTNHDMSLCNIV